MDYGLLKNIHFATTTLYIVFFLVKVVLVLTNKEEQLKVFKKKTLVLEISLPLIFIITGVIMLMQGSPLYHFAGAAWFHPKMTGMVLGIILGIIGIKKMNKVLVVIALFCFLSIHGYTEMQEAKMNKGTTENLSTSDLATEEHLSDEKIFQTHCANCHRGSEEKNLAGAPVLAHSTLNFEEKVAKIKSGGGGMTAFEKILKAQEIISLVHYIDSAKTK